jgi:hypothetical protein
MAVQLLDNWPQHYEGVVTGNNSGIFPDSIMMSGYHFTTQTSAPYKTIRISGLNINKKYNLIFFNGTTRNTAQLTYFTAGGQTVSLEASNNSSKTAQLNGLQASEGSIDVVVNGVTDKNAVINALVIQEYDNTIILPPFNLNMSKSSRNSISLSWKSNANNATAFEVWRSDASNGDYVKLPATIPPNVFTYTDAGLQTGALYYYKVRAVSGSNFSDFSDYVSGATIKYAININFNDGSELGPSQPAPWNNTNLLVYEGFTLPNLLNDENQNTGINMTIVGSLNSFSGTNRQDNTLTTGNNSGAVPDIVMSTFYFLEYGQIGKIRIDGLNQSMRYNFIFYGGCKDRGKGQVTTYSIGNESVDLDAKNNTMNTIQINNVAPDAMGSVLISLTPTILSGFGYINSLGIQAIPLDINTMPSSGRKVTGDGSVALLNIDSVSESKTSGNIILGAYPNPFVDDITLKLSLDNPVNKVVVLLKDISGKSIFSTTLMNLQKGISERKLGLKGSRLSPGVYGVQLLGLPKGEKASIIVVK